MDTKDDKTVKLRAMAEPGRNGMPANAPEDMNVALELAMKDAQIEEERTRGLEQLKTIVQLRESLKLEQAKTLEFAKRLAEQETKAKELAAQESDELAKTSALLDEERKKTAEQAKVIDLLQIRLKEEQVKNAAAMQDQAARETVAKERAALEAKVRAQADALEKIVVLASSARPQ